MPVDPKKLRGLTDEAAALGSEGSLPHHSDRRSFLKKAGLGGAVAAGVALVPASAFAADTTTTTAPTAAAPTTTAPLFLSPDLKLAAFAQKLEVVATQVYTLLKPQLTATNVKDAADAFMVHHQDAAIALGALLTPGTPTDFNTLTVDPTLLRAFQPQINAASGQNAALEVLLNLEQTAVATHLNFLGQLNDAYNAGAFAKIEAVECQHAAIWAQTLGKPIDTVLPTEVTTAGALNPADYAS